MIQTIRSNERYHAETGWLDTHWHFSFDHYHDPENMGFGPLRVFNDDVIAPAAGFPFHGHREMEILSYMVEGSLEHHDDLGNTGIIRPGEIQRMSAGTGVRHSEANHSKKDPAHLLQIWIQPSVRHLTPSWEQKSFTEADRTGKLLAIAVPAGGKPNGAVQIQQDATLYTSLLNPGQSVVHTLAQGRRAYLFVVAGNLKLNGETYAAGDQARITGERELRIEAPAGAGTTAADFLLFDLP